MHLKPIRTAVTPTSPNGFWPAYNLFRCKRSLDLFCAVPEDYPGNYPRPCVWLF